MRYYHIDEIDPENIARIKAALEARGMRGSIDDVYFLDIPAELLSDEQSGHAADCGPHILTIETGEDWLRLELLVRARNRLRCSCVHYALPRLREYAVEWLDAFIREQDIQV